MDKKVVNVGALKVGSYVIFNDIACKITSIDISRTGKHGHAKARIAAVGLIDGRKIIKIHPHGDKVDVPIVEKENAQVLSVQGDMATIMDLKTYETFDIKIPEEFKDNVAEGKQVLYWLILGEKVIKQVK